MNPASINFSEARVPAYDLPDPLDGVTDLQAWSKRRGDLVGLFAEHVYGRTPGRPVEMEVTVGAAVEVPHGTRREVTVRLAGRHNVDVLVYAPVGPYPAPVFLGLNFLGNHTITSDTDVTISRTQDVLASTGIDAHGVRHRLVLLHVSQPDTDLKYLAANSPVSGGEIVLSGGEPVGVIHTDWPAASPHHATGVAFVRDDHVSPGTELEVDSLGTRLPAEVAVFEPVALRGALASRWPISLCLQRGFVLVTAYCGDLAPDLDGGHRTRVASLFPHSDWGAIGIWAWGLSRVLDALAEIEQVDATRVAVVGHSRLGKAALWAAAQDERFAMAISNNSGCLGAALSRRWFGETIEALTSRYRHWGCAALRGYAANEPALPVDQHELLALIAPRPLYVASAADDLWADPTGERRAVDEARPVYDLLGAAERLSYHVRPGTHEATRHDWERYLDFADRFLRR